MATKEELIESIKSMTVLELSELLEQRGWRVAA